MTVVVVMQCPECTYTRKFPEGDEYTQEDLMCPNHAEVALVVQSTYEETDFGREPLPDAPAPPPAPEDRAEPRPEALPLQPVEVRLERIRAIARECRSAERAYQDAKGDADEAKKLLAKKLKELRDFIASDDERERAALPLFDEERPIGEPPSEEPGREAPADEPRKDDAEEIEDIEDEDEDEGEAEEPEADLSDTELRERLKELNVEVVEEEESEPKPH